MNYMNNMAHVGKIIQAVGCNAAYQSFKRDLQRDLQRDLSRVVVMTRTGDERSKKNIQYTEDF
jgi:hypothetical protein